MMIWADGKYGQTHYPKAIHQQEVVIDYAVIRYPQRELVAIPIFPQLT